MRHSLFGGLVLATTAVLIGPGLARGQAPWWSPPPDSYAARGQMDSDAGIPGQPAIIAPLPTGNPGGNGFYAFSEFVFLTQTFALGNQTIAVRGLIDSSGVVTGIPGTLIGSGTPALSTDTFGRRSFEPGWNVGLGYKFDNGVSVYGQFMQVLRQHYSAGASLVPPYFRSNIDLADTYLTAPVFNFSP